MQTFIMLLRGINVGGNHILPMKEFKAVLESLGLENVRTYIQSGNVVFQNENIDLDSLSRDIRSAINESHGFMPQVLLRPVEEMKRAIASNPFPDAESEPKSLHLFFLAAVANNPDMDRLEALKTDSEQFELIGNVFYLHTPDGIGRSKVAANVEKALGVPLTARNWRSVNQIMSMAVDMTA